MTTASLAAPAERTVRAPGPRLGFSSLTSRLVVGVVALVVVVIAVIGGGTYYFLHNSLLDQLDDQVRTSASTTSGFVERCKLDPDANCEKGIPAPRHEWVTIANPGWSIEVGSDSNATVMNLTNAQKQAFLDDRNLIITIYQDGKELRVAAAKTRTLGLTVVTGLSTDDVDATMHRLLFLEILIGGAAVMVAVAATTYGVQRSLRNLYRVTGTAQEVAAELSPSGSGLERRVPVVEEGTEVGQLAESFNTMLAAVETQFAARVESEERMRQFMADASHELRTPLTSIRGYAELARMQRAIGEASEDNLARIESEGTRMSRLIEDLLMLARGDADGRPTERLLIDVADLLDDAVSGARAAFPERAIELEISGTPHVIGDNDQLLRAVRNLINNAAVHTDRARPILVRSWADPEGVTIQVIDGGPGLPPEQAALVFERFWRADKARTRARGGTGLGLSIVASIVRANQGAVRFDSSVENGSTVSVRLPNADPE